MSEDSEAEGTGIKKRAISGVLYSVLNVGGRQFLRLVGNLITTRLLFPEAFGLMLLVLTVNQGLMMISDVGIVPAIIQNEKGDQPRFLNTAWTISVIRGALVSVAVLILAWPVSQFYGEPQLFPLVLLAASQGLISGLDSTKLALLNRQIRVGRLVWVDILSQLSTLVITITWALIDRSVWALAVGSVIGDAVRMVLTHVLLPGPNNRFAWDKEAAVEIVRFGKWIFLSTALTYLAIRFDVIALGRLEALNVLGVYNIGQNLANLPILLTGQAVAWVLLPALSESFREDKEAFGTNVRAARQLINTAGVLMIGATAIGAPGFFYVLYDDRYADAGWIVQLLMFSTWLFFLQETTVRILVAMGDSRGQMLANAAKLVGTVPGALLGFHIARVPGLIVGLSLGSFAGYVTVGLGVQAKGIPVFLTDAKWTLLGLAVCLLGGGTPWLVGPLLGIDAPLVSLAIGPVVLVPYAIYAGRKLLHAIRSRRRPATTE